MTKHTRRAARVLIAASLLTALAAPGPSSARPFDHVVAGVGTSGIGDRLAIYGYDSLLADDGGGAFIRTYLGRTTIDVPFDCLVVGFIPQHTVYASGTGTNGTRYYIGVQDNTTPPAIGPYDTISISTTPGTGPCGAWFFNTVNWFPVSFGDFIIAP